MTLPANSTFLPILDDLLSPDFRPVLLPAQTPQTPTDIVSFAGGKIITNAFGNITFSRGGGNINKGMNAMSKSVIIDSNGFGQGNNQKTTNKSSDEAAAKIQNWWKSRSKRSNSFDIGAERAKHSLRHNRTEDHIRYLENEVSRLKSALSAERKIRSLQLEAIRSLWSQVQRISTSDSTNAGSSSLMTRSVPNGLAISNNNKEESGPNKMSMSMNAALESTVNVPSHSQGAGGDVHASCSCSKEVQSLRESLAEEMSQLRAKLDQLTVKDSSTTTTTSTTTTKTNENLNQGKNEVSNTSLNNLQNILEEGETSSTSSNTGDSNSDNTEIKQQHKRPFSLNLTGISNNPKSPEEKEQINDYAESMASKLVEDELKK